MYLKLLIITIILVAVIMLALGIKLLFNPEAEYTIHTCALDGGDLDEYGACSKCRLMSM